MTLENYYYRTDPLFLRNQFDEEGDNKFKIPQIPKTALLLFPPIWYPNTETTQIKKNFS